MAVIKWDWNVRKDMIVSASLAFELLIVMSTNTKKVKRTSILSSITGTNYLGVKK